MTSSYTKQTIGIFWQHAWKYPSMVIGALIASPINVLINQIIPPLILANIIQRLASGDYQRGNMIGSFGPTLLLYGVLIIVAVSGWRLVDWFVYRLEMRVFQDMSHTIYQHLLTLSADFHSNTFGGSLVSQNNKFLGAYVRIADTTFYGTSPMIWTMIFASIVMIRRAPLFVLVINLVAVLFVAVAVAVTKRTRQASAKHAESESAQTGALADSITNVLAIKSYAGMSHEIKRFKTYTDQARSTLSELMKSMVIQLTTFGVLSRIMDVAALLVAVFAIVEQNANLATVFLILNLTNTITDKLFDFTQTSLKNYNRAFGDASGMTEILLTKPTIVDPAVPQPVRMKHGTITFDTVDFTHKGSTEPLFTNFSLHIKAGERIGLVGHSGSGKTTLTRLLLRFSDVNDGSIAIDGQDIRNVTQDDLHERITYVPQEPLLFHRSLAENIGYGKKNASQKEIEHVSKLAHADEFIQSLPHGYETLVGERGVKLSGGQRQRIAIARAMIKDAPIVVLDEATSALDSESEMLIQDALWKLMEGKTAIVIAHRLSTIQKMDRIVVMDNGRIVEEGSHAALLKKKRKYAELWAHQSGGFIED